MWFAPCNGRRSLEESLKEALKKDLKEALKEVVKEVPKEAMMQPSRNSEKGFDEALEKVWASEDDGSRTS
jgi:hypothetical protein